MLLVRSLASLWLNNNILDTTSRVDRRVDNLPGRGSSHWNRGCKLNAATDDFNVKSPNLHSRNNSVQSTVGEVWCEEKGHHTSRGVCGADSDRHQGAIRLRHAHRDILSNEWIQRKVWIISIVILRLDLELNVRSPNSLCGHKGHDGLGANITSSKRESSLVFEAVCSKWNAIQATEIRVGSSNGDICQRNREDSWTDKDRGVRLVKSSGISGHLTSEVSRQSRTSSGSQTCDRNGGLASSKCSESSSSFRLRSSSFLELLGDGQGVHSTSRSKSHSKRHSDTVRSNWDGVLSGNCGNGRGANLDIKSCSCAQSGGGQKDFSRINLRQGVGGLNSSRGIHCWVHKGWSEWQRSAIRKLSRESLEQSRVLQEVEGVQSSISTIGC